MRTRKLSVAVAALIVTAMASFATVSVDWFTVGQLNDPETGLALGLGNLAQLIWTPTASIDPLLNTDPTTPQGDDILMDNYFIGDSAPPFNDVPGRIFEGATTYDASLAGAWGAALGEDYFVGGYVYTRVFNSSSPGGGTWYLDAPVPPVGGLNDQDPAVGSPGPSTACDPTGGSIVVLDQRIAAIPEPTTWAFMGIGLLTIVYRRKVRK